MSEQTVFDTFTFRGRCGCTISVVGAVEQEHDCPGVDATGGGRDG